MVDDPWLHVRGDAMLGELARLEHRFDDAVLHLGPRRGDVGRLGFLQTEAYQLSSLGRAQCQAGDYEAGAATPRARDREGRGHRRRAAGGARAGAPRARAARARSRRRRRATRSRRRRRGTAPPAAGSRRARRVPARRDGRTTSTACTQILDESPEPHVAVFALDALGRVEEADKQMALAAHFISERDRVDRVPTLQR